MFRRIAVIVCYCLLLVGCSKIQGSAMDTAQIFAMDTMMEISVYDGEQGILDEATEFIKTLEAELSTTDEDSEIYKLNHTGTAVFSKDACNLLEQTLEICEKTEGILDISIYPIVKEWGFTTNQYQIPKEERVHELLKLVDYKKVELVENQVTLAPGMEIDLGSVTKGFVGDQLVEQFQKAGITSALLNLGGNVQALGAKPDGSPWKVGVQDPRGDDYVAVISIVDQAVVTSGGYERFFKGEDGEIYWHIINPMTGKSARSGILSTTVIGDKGVYCDALSTSLFIMGEEKATDFWRKYRDFEMILVTDQHEILITPGLEDAFQLSGNTAYTLRMIGND